MYFSMIKLRRGITPRGITELTRLKGYHAHQLVWDLFADDPNRQRDFLYRQETVNGWPTFYTVSKREPEDKSGAWEVSPKQYNPLLRAGQRLGFTLCANPIRSRRDDNGRQQRHDVVMEAKLKLKELGERFNLPEIVQERGFQWLSERTAAHGFIVSPDGVRVDGYQQHKLFKGRGGKPITFSTLDFNGILTVTDPTLFVESCLFGGIGPAKGFGCGLMLVRRIEG